MFSQELLSLIKWHELSLFGGSPEIPEHIYGRDSAGQYYRRLTRSPLAPFSPTDEIDPKTQENGSYVIRIARNGKIEVIKNAKG